MPWFIMIMVTWGSYDHMITWGSYVAPSAATNAGGAAAWGLLWPPAIRRHWEVTLWENVVFLRWFLWIYLLLVNVIPDYAAEFLSRAISRTSPREINGEHLQGDLDSVRVIPISVPKRKNGQHPTTSFDRNRIYCNSSRGWLLGLFSFCYWGAGTKTPCTISNNM